MNRFALCCVAALGLFTGCKKDVSGSYLATDSVAVCWLQLVRTPDDHLTGQLVSSVLKPDGQIEHGSTSLTGAVNGENITLTGGGFLGMATTTLSGSFDNEALTLTGVQSAPVTLKRATLMEYQAKLGEQTTRSQTIISANAAAKSRQNTFQGQRNFIAEVDQVVSGMQRFDSEADIHLGKFPNVEKSYEAITAKVNEYVTRERQLGGNPNRAVDRAQLDVAATQASLNTEHAHLQGQALQLSLEANIGPIVNEAIVLEQNCRQTRTAGGDLTPTEIEAHQAACSRLLSASPTFHQNTRR